jgi:hypothetical protein
MRGVAGFARQTRIERDAAITGTKEKPYRKQAMAVLAGAPPTGRPNGTFCTLCAHVLPELGEDTEGSHLSGGDNSVRQHSVTAPSILEILFGATMCVFQL